MPCSLKPDPTGAFDFLAVKGKTFTVFYENDPDLAKIVNADLNGAPLPLPAPPKGTITVPPADARNLLDIVFVVDPGVPLGTDIRLMEDCGDGTTQTVLTFTWNGNPLKGHQFNAI